MSAESVIANKGLIKGFLTPIFYDEYGRFSALGPADFQKVRDGYACSKCLAEYTTYLVRCPVCKHERDVMADLEDPRAEHVNHLQDRAATEGQEVGVPRNFDEFMAGLRENKDVDHTTLSKLKARRRK